jgi:hypothetical protein
VDQKTSALEHHKGAAPKVQDRSKAGPPAHPNFKTKAGPPVLRRGVDSGVIEETARLDESYTPIPLKHLASCQIEGSR